ncbi:MAG TPA: hypothetical protein VG755_40845, partial [Nannocystaceae bacterium]|nr:hypothetical protein [Nannocystaceae bacterium]
MRRLSAIAALVVACGGDDAVMSDETSGADTSTAGSSSTSPTTTIAPDTSVGSESSVGSSEESTTGTPSDCGDGERTGLEQCDDGNDTPGDGCEPGCLLPSGESVWTVAVDGGDDDVASDVAVRADGSIVVVGQRGDDSWIGVYGPDGTELSSDASALG